MADLTFDEKKMACLSHISGTQADFMKMLDKPEQLLEKVEAN